jgi:hypothetical protein
LDSSEESTPFLEADTRDSEEIDDEDEDGRGYPARPSAASDLKANNKSGKLGFKETAKISFQFSLLWVSHAFISLRSILQMADRYSSFP